MKWFWRIAAVVAVVAGVTLGSYVHAHAVTATPTAKTPVVYALDGYTGFSHQYVRPIRFSMEQGTNQWRHAGWRWGSTSATSRHAQYRYVSGGTAGPWQSVVLKFTSIRRHKIKNLGGGYIYIKYFIRAKLTFPGSSVVKHFCFGRGSGTKVPVWYGC